MWCLLVRSSTQHCALQLVQEAEDKPEQPKATEKPAFEDDFFDSISSDATGRWPAPALLGIVL